MNIRSIWLTVLAALSLTSCSFAQSTNPLPTSVTVANAANPTQVEGAQVPLSTDLSGNLRTIPYVTTSAANSTTATLTGGSTFTGTFEDVSAYAELDIVVASDRSSGANGIVVQWSYDGSNNSYADKWSYQCPTPGTVFGIDIKTPVRGRYFRINYTNGGTNQGTFNLKTYYRAANPSVHRVIPTGGYVEYNGLLLPVQTAVINTASSGNTTLWTITSANSTIRVLGIDVMASGTTVVKLQDGAATLLYGQMALTASVQYHANPQWPCFIGQCGFGQNLVINNGSAIQISGTVYFIEAPSFRSMGGPQ